MVPRDLVPVAADWGAVLLASGAEIRQVEEGLYALFAAHRLQAEVFVLLKGIFLSAWEPGESPVSLIRHVRGGLGVDLTRLGRALALAGPLADPNLEASAARVLVAELSGPRPERGWLLPLAAAGTAGIYGLFFGGTWAEAVAATLLAAGVQGLRLLAGRWALPSLVEVFLSSLTLALGALGTAWTFPGLDPVKVLTGGVMILIPGVALVNGIKDVLHGDTVSSLYRLAEAGLQTAAIAAGVALALAWGWPHA